MVRPGEFLAIMGASGAGKSTLLNTLLFRNLSGLKVSGLRLANNKVVTPTSLTAVSAYVQQDDLFIGSLTVRESLVFQVDIVIISCFLSGLYALMGYFSCGNKDKYEKVSNSRGVGIQFYQDENTLF